MTERQEPARDFETHLTEKAEAYGLSTHSLRKAVREELRRLVAAEIAEQVRAGDVEPPEPIKGGVV